MEKFAYKIHGLEARTRQKQSANPHRVAHPFPPRRDLPSRTNTHKSGAVFHRTKQSALPVQHPTTISLGTTPYDTENDQTIRRLARLSPRAPSHLVRMSSDAIVRKASSTFEAFLALVSKKGMPKESANSLATAVSTTLSPRSLLFPASEQNTTEQNDLRKNQTHTTAAHTCLTPKPIQIHPHTHYSWINTETWTRHRQIYGSGVRREIPSRENLRQHKQDIIYAEAHARRLRGMHESRILRNYK